MRFASNYWIGFAQKMGLTPSRWSFDARTQSIRGLSHFLGKADWTFGCCWLVLAAIAGCGTQPTPSQTQTGINDTSVADLSDEASGLPLLAVPNPDDAAAGNKGKVSKASSTNKAAPTLLPKGLFGKKAAQDNNAASNDQPAQKPLEKGSPEWLLDQIQRVRILPLPQEAILENDDDEEEDKPLTAEQEKKLAQEIERNKSIRRERNLQIVKLAEECIQKTNRNPDQEPLFCAAVHNLLDARLQLALQGDTESIEAIYEASKVFFDRNPKSDSASEAALTLVNLTHANARRYGSKDPRWMAEFAKQTQSYATRFPEELPRSVPLLMVAARSCEMNGQPAEATECYQLLSSKFKETAQGQQATNVLRRLQLKGQELELMGPGIDGSEINVKSMKGKMVLVIFWASNAQPFLQQLPKLTEVLKRFRDYVTVVGVNLDTDEKAVDAFIEKHHLEWQQIFPENRQQRGWNSPSAIYFGITSLPTMFLLDPNGVVQETNLDASNLEAKIREVYQPFRPQQPRKKKAPAPAK